MRFLGSKRRLAKHILPIMLKEMADKGINTWVEPFVGGGNIIDKVPPEFKRIGYDIDPHVIEALITIRDFPERLPKNITEEEYRSIRGTDPHPINSWVRFACSFGGKFDGGYARSWNAKGERRNHCLESYNDAQKQSKHLKGVTLMERSYEDIALPFENTLVYCDPPYRGTTQYKWNNFDHDKFFEWCRYISGEGYSVFVSEYNAPDDFEIVYEKDLNITIDSNRIKGTKAVERLFKVP